jgi:hypothetical protein
MCLWCQEINPATPRANAHQSLVHEGFVRPTEKHRENHREDRFRCASCDTRWIKETDKWGMDLGFRLAPVQANGRTRFPYSGTTTPAATAVHGGRAAMPVR